MAFLCHPANALTNIDDKGEDLAVHRQACIYGFGSSLSISYPGLKAVQLCQAPNRFKTVPDVCGSGYPLPISYPGLKAVQLYQVLIRGLRQSNCAKSLSGL